MPSVTLPLLYSFRRCPYAMRARFALAASGQRCELREVLLRDKPAELLAVSPKGTVPVLVLPDGTVIDESLAVMHWALAKRDPQQWLVPATSHLDDMLALIAACDGPFKRALDRYKYPGRFVDVDEAGGADALAHRSDGATWLTTLETRLQTAPRLFGPQAALADWAIAPFVRQFSMVEPDWFAAQPWPALRRWLPALTESALWAQATHKQPPWRPGDAPIAFPSA